MIEWKNTNARDKHNNVRKISYMIQETQFDT